MTIMFVIGGLVVGLLVFLMIRRKWNKAEAADKYKDLTLTCPACQAKFNGAENWRRNGLRGVLFKCPACHTKVWQ